MGHVYRLHLSDELCGISDACHDTEVKDERSAILLGNPYAIRSTQSKTCAGLLKALLPRPSMPYQDASFMIQYLERERLKMITPAQQLIG